MKVVILQPSYIPWRGYFHQVQMADLFIFYDCVQFDKHGWRNRNLIKNANGTQWLTVPVKSKGCVKHSTPISEIEIASGSEWRKKHFRAIRESYSKAPFLNQYLGLLEEIFNRRDLKLVDLTCSAIELIASELGIRNTEFLRSSELSSRGEKSQKLIDILKRVGATHYISGPAAESYLDDGLFLESGISVEYMRYNYREYPQLHGEFIGGVSVIDMLLNLGSAAGGYIWE